MALLTFAQLQVRYPIGSEVIVWHNNNNNGALYDAIVENIEEFEEQNGAIIYGARLRLKNNPNKESFFVPQYQFRGPNDEDLPVYAGRPFNFGGGKSLKSLKSRKRQKTQRRHKSQRRQRCRTHNKRIR